MREGKFGGLLQTGNPGNKGGYGRPPNELRARMRQHLDEELIQACLDDWKAGKLNPLQVAEFFAKHALPVQSEKLDEHEGRQMIEQTLGRMVEALLAAKVDPQVVGAAYDLAIQGLA